MSKKSYSYSYQKKYIDKYRNSEKGKEKVKEATKRYQQKDSFKNYKRELHRKKQETKKKLIDTLKILLLDCKNIKEIKDEKDYNILLDLIILSFHLFFKGYHYTISAKTFLTSSDLNKIKDKKNYINIVSLVYYMNRNKKQRLINLRKKILFTNIIIFYLNRHPILKKSERILIRNIPFFVHHDCSRVTKEEIKKILDRLYKNAETKV